MDRRRPGTDRTCPRPADYQFACSSLTSSLPSEHNFTYTIHSYTEVVSMLVLSRKESERIRLGDSIIVTVVRVSGDKVRLGIEAPPTCSCSERNWRSTPPGDRTDRVLSATT